MNRSEASHGYAIRGDKEGKQRLNLLARVMLPTTSQLLKTVGLRQGMECLDVGCGGGHVSLLMANMIGPAGKVVGTDTDKEIIELAKEDGKHRFMHAFPSVDNPPSNAICRKLGFTFLEACDFEFPPGNPLRCNDWRLDLRGRRSSSVSRALPASAPRTTISRGPGDG